MDPHGASDNTAPPSGAWPQGGRAFVVGILVTATACGPQSPPPSTGEPILTPTANPAESQTVSWRTATPSAITLEFAPLDDPDRVARVEGTRTDAEHEDADRVQATVTDLEPDTEYQYRVGSEESGFDDWRSFTTAATTPEPFTFLYFGDVQTEIPDEAAPVIHAGLDAHPEAEIIVHGGDLIDEAHNADQWQEWYDAYGVDALAERNQVAAVGNHEYDDGLSRFWRSQFPSAGNGPDAGVDLAETVSYTDYQGVRFVTLNSNYRDAPADDEATDWLAEQDAWLESVLSDNPHDWSVVAFHHPLFPNRPDRDNEPLRAAWLETLEDHDVDLVLQGHDHSYGRGNLTDHETDEGDHPAGPVYVVAVTGPKMYETDPGLWEDNHAEVQVQREGTQTFQVITVEGDTMRFSARTPEGELVDEFRIVRDSEGERVLS